MTTTKDRMMWRVHKYVYPRLGRYRPDLAIDSAMFRGFQDPSLQDIANDVMRTRFFCDFDGVDGWITIKERQLLYAFGRWHPGPFLEIGSWVGMSTCHLSSGIRDSGLTKHFVTCDLNPTAANFRRTAEGMGFYYPADSAENMGSCSMREYKEEVEPVITSPAGVLGTLRRNLRRHGLEKFVNIHEGSYSDLPEQRFGFIFVDAMHTPTEIARNAALLEPFLSAGTLLICHDLKCHPDNERTLRRSFSYGHTIALDQMFIGEIV